MRVNVASHQSNVNSDAQMDWFDWTGKEGRPT
jgi:hypothetical protein